MLFTSTRFLLFFSIVVPAFFLTPRKFRWLLLLGASYYFYMNWRVSYLALIVASTLVSYFCGMGIDGATGPTRRNIFLCLAVIGNLGMLFYFKYSAFAVETLGAALRTFGSDVPLHLTAPLLPVGISFFVFQSLSYVFDVYRRDRPREKHPGVFAAYIAYFPQLVAGPIERSTRLLPQFHEHQRLDWQRTKSGLALMLWGWFKKLVVADNLALIVEKVYSHPVGTEGSLLSLATLLFAFQIYCDFSAYSDIAVGSARIMGFSLMENFNRPYLATSIPDFWRRWHISLSTWFRDYLYFPLGGNRVRLPRWTLNILLVFLLSGLWHGANWTFVAWGVLHGAYMLVSRFTRGIRTKLLAVSGLAKLPTLHRLLVRTVTLLLVCVAWVFFRADGLSDAFYILTHLHTGWLALATDGLRSILLRAGMDPSDIWGALGWIALVQVADLITQPGMKRLHPASFPLWAKWTLAYTGILLILLCVPGSRNPFIYFQF